MSSQLPLGLGSEWFVPRDALGSVVPAVPWVPGGPRGLPLILWRNPLCLLAPVGAALAQECAAASSPRGWCWISMAMAGGVTAKDGHCAAGITGAGAAAAAVPTSARTRDCGPSICHRPNCPRVVLLQRECHPPSCSGLVLPLYEASGFLHALPRRAVSGRLRRTRARAAQDALPRAGSPLPCHLSPGTSERRPSPAQLPLALRQFTGVFLSLAHWLEM